MSNSDELVERVMETWRPFEQALRQLGPQGIDARTPAGWSAKEMLGHVAFWDEAVVGAITGMIRAQPMPEGWGFGSGYVPEGDWPRADVHNAREAAWAREQTADAVLARLWSAHSDMVALLHTVTPEELRTRDDYFGQLGGHYREHLPELAAIL